MTHFTRGITPRTLVSGLNKGAGGPAVILSLLIAVSGSGVSPGTGSAPMNATIIDTLNAISARLTTTVLRQMDNAVIIQHANCSTVAAGFLKAEKLR
jgi:hypothetical protein